MNTQQCALLIISLFLLISGCIESDTYKDQYEKNFTNATLVYKNSVAGSGEVYYTFIFLKDGEYIKCDTGLPEYFMKMDINKNYSFYIDGNNNIILNK